jgi:UDP:flavonoid glycosyltransferase YjiC (YdhE family)
MRALVVTQPGDGHLNPLVPVARALVDAGHEVLVATSPAYVEDVERTGLAAVGIGPPYRWDAAVEIWPDCADVSGEDSALFWFQRVQRDITVPFVRGLCELVRQDRPDLLIAEWSVATWGQAVRDLEGVPFVVTAWAVEPGHEDEVVGLEEGGANRARAVLGLPPIDAVDPAVWISFTPPSWAALDGPPLPNTRRVRLPFEPSADPVPGFSDDVPYVYATLGTVFYTMRRLLRTFIAAIDTGGWSGLVTVGRKNDPARFESPPRVAVEQYVAQADALAVADVMVCHGGLGSMLGAMSQGCPMVVVPLGGDQLHNAQRAHRLGIARLVDPAEVTVDALQTAIAEALASTEQADACRTLQREIEAMRDVDHLISELETAFG